MALTPTTTLNGNAGNDVAREKKVYALIRKGLYPLQLLDINEVEDRDFSDPTKKVQKLSFKFVIVETDSEFYGRFLWVQVTPILSPPRGDKKESNLHKLLKNLVNNGEDMSEGQIAAFANNPADQLNALIDPASPTFCDGIVAVETSKTKVKDEATGQMIARKYNRLGDISPAEGEYAPYVQVEHLDPQNEGEDETIVCEYDACSRIVRGWSKRDGSWMSQTDWVEFMDAKYAGHYCREHLAAVKAEPKPF